jgi:probable phosphoglycerate mutase
MGKVLCGRAPGFRLNANGQQQAQTLGCKLAAISDLRAAYASPLERAQETAEPIAEKHALPVQVDEHFNEVDYGTWTGKTFEEIKKDGGWDPYNRLRSLGSVPGGEGLLAVQSRAWRGVESILARHREGTVAVVTHADVIRALLLLFLAMPLDCVMRLEVAPASVSEVSLWHGAAPVVHRINAVGND